MAGSPLKRLIVQTSHYSLSSLLAMVAGLVTFPLLTRLFSVTEYGIMSLIGATITVSVAVGKVGVQHSILRYHSEFATGQGRYSVAQLSSTTLLAMLVTGGGAALAVAGGIRLLPARWLDSQVPGLMAIAAVVIAVQVLESGVVGFMRAEQRTSQLMIYQVLKKYLGLGFILFALLALARSLTAFYTATALSEALAFGVLVLVMFRREMRPRPSRKQFSWHLYVELLKFGVPMLIGYELSSIVLSVGDRYVISGTIGEQQLGLYAAAYNLCQYVQAMVITSLGQAIMPMYMQMWEQKGRDETLDFLNRSLRGYVLVGAPVIAGLAVVGPELLPALASDKYASASAVLPWVIAGMVVQGAANMFAAGLYIHRKTHVVMAIVVSSAFVNLGMNIVLVPRVGILGAGITTLVSYTANTMALAVATRHLLPVKIPWVTILRAGSAAMVMWLALRNLYPGHRFFTVGLRMGLGAVFYGLAIIPFDHDARAIARKMASWFRSHFRAS